MTPIQWIRDHLVASVLTAAGLAGLAAGALVPPPRASGEATRAGDWALPPPAVLARTSDAEFASVRNAPIWGAAATGPAGAVKASSWKLTGIISRPVPVALVTVTGARQVLALKAGDPLPDGGTVTSVAPASLAYTREGCRYERALYAAAETPQGGACAAPAPATAPPPTQAPSP